MRIQKRKRSIFSIMMAFAMMILMVFPTIAFAEGDEPAVEETPVVEETTEETAAEEPAAEETEETAVEETPVTEEVIEEPAAEEPVVEETPVAEEPTEESAVEEPIVEEDLGEIVAALNEAGAVLVDEGGEVIPLASEEAAEVLAAPDPWYTYDGTTYRFFKTPVGDEPDPCASYIPGECFTDDNPIQLAVNDAKTRVAAVDDSDRVTICVEEGDYDGHVLIDTPVWLQGLPGATIIGDVDIQSSWVTLDGFTIEGSVLSRISPTSDEDAYGYQNIQISNNVITPDTSVTSHPDTPAGEQEGGGVSIYIGTRSETFNQSGLTQSVYIGYRDLHQLPGLHVLDYDPVAIPNTYLIGKGLLNYAGLIISGNTMTGGRSGIILQGITGESDNSIKVEGNTITTITDRALIWIDSSQWIDIDHNTLADSTGYGVYFSSLADGYYTARSADTPYTPKNISITCNTITNNYRGIYVGDAYEDMDLNNDSLTIWNNNISGNDAAIEVHWGYNDYIDARGNFWGSNAPTPDGGSNIIRFWVPGTSYLNADYVLNTAILTYIQGGTGRVYFGPFLGEGEDPCSDGTCSEFLPLESEVGCQDVDDDGVCGFVDNCIDTYNPDQLDSDGDGIGDACDPTPFPPEEPPAAPVVPPEPGPLIPVTGGQLIELPCGTECVTLELPDGSQAEFCGLCGYWVSLSEESEETIPFDMPDGTSMLKGMTVVLMDPDQVLLDEVPAGATLKLSYQLATGVKADTLSMYLYDHIKEEWVELTAEEVLDYLEAYAEWPGTSILVE